MSLSTIWGDLLDHTGPYHGTDLIKAAGAGIIIAGSSAAALYLLTGGTIPWPKMDALAAPTQQNQTVLSYSDLGMAGRNWAVQTASIK